MKISDLKQKKIAVLGFGMEGKSSLNFLKSIGIEYITILDKNIHDVTFFKKKYDGLKFEFGEKYLCNLGDFDIIFRTPGISPYNNKILKKYKNNLISQSEIFFSNYSGKVIGITGTKGKSTISSLTYEILKGLGYNVKLVGNIGSPVLDEIDIISGDSYDFIVYELSSYMLEGFSPNLFIGLLNNIYDCHLDWHDGRKNYEFAKLNILNNSKFKFAQLELKDFLNNLKYQNISYFGSDVNFNLKGAFLKGIHNLKNISGVLSIINSCVSDSLTSINNHDKNNIIQNILINFKGLPHRQQNIGTYNGIIFIDDSIASTPESAIAAIDTFSKDIGTLFIGNEDSGFDFINLEKSIKNANIQNLVIFPTTGEKLFSGFGKTIDFDKIVSNPFFSSNNSKGFILKTLSMRNAVDFAYKNTSKGKLVLLSTGAPSFNAKGTGLMPWKSYLEKGKLFEKYVKLLGN